MITKLSRKLHRANHSLITEFSTMTMAKMDRPLSPTRMAHLRRIVKEGNFLSAVWACVTCKADGKTYRINGKHTSTLFSQMNGEMPKDIEIVVERFQCDTLEEVAHLYSSYDNKDSTRNQSAITRIWAATCPELEGVDARVLSCIVTSLSISESGTKVHGLTAEDRAKKMVQYKDFALFVSQLISGQNLESKHLLRGPVISAMFLTWKKDHDASAKFWKLVKRGEGAPGSTVRKLERYLLTTNVNWGSGARHPEKKPAAPREMLVKCLHAWNAWRTNSSTDMKYFPNSAIPVLK